MKDKVLGRGLATAGIWVGIGLIGLADQKGWSAVAAFFAFIATFVVWSGRD